MIIKDSYQLWIRFYRQNTQHHKENVGSTDSERSDVICEILITEFLCI